MINYLLKYKSILKKYILLCKLKNINIIFNINTSCEYQKSFDNFLKELNNHHYNYCNLLINNLLHIYVYKNNTICISAKNQLTNLFKLKLENKKIKYDLIDGELNIKINQSNIENIINIMFLSILEYK